jgi:cell division protein FtsN
MRYLKFLLLGLMILYSSCAATNKRLIKSESPVVEQPAPKFEEEKLPEAGSTAKDVKEIEEKLVPFEQTKASTQHYFVIVGSFREPGNAKKRQKELLSEGFSSQILKNEAGLYRVSVLATDDIDAARDDIRRIRRIFPKLFDAWLLIQIK